MRVRLVLVWVQLVTYLPVALLLWWEGKTRLALAQILLAVVTALVYL